jgi:hypothetical protein
MENGKKNKYKYFLGQSLRLSLTGEKVGPPITDILEVLDESVIKKRIKNYVEFNYDNPLDQILLTLCFILFIHHYANYKNNWTVEEIWGCIQS